MSDIGGLPKNKRKKKSLVKRLFNIVLRFFLVFFLASILQVLVFKWLPPLFTPKMVFDWVESYFDNTSGKFELKYKWKPIKKISPYMPLAVMAAEDQTFPNHFGFDVEAIEKAIKHNQAGKRVRGASTLTQQVAKNLFLWPSRDYLRKGLEAYYTVLMELLWSKQRIVEMYVNIAEMGYGVYGVEAASQNFFNKKAIKINRYEAAVLAAVLPNPIKLKAKNPSAYVLGRRNWIMKQMYQLGDIKYLEKIK